MAKCGQEKFRKLINTMKITPKRLKSIIKETINEYVDTQSSDYMSQARNLQRLSRRASQGMSNQDREEMLKELMVVAFMESGYGPHWQRVGHDFPDSASLENIFRSAIDQFKEVAEEKYPNTEEQAQ
tara:strand:+ start:544 stop:924 length:381 start_codon:yes stop_codon:yes gene_type:complete